MKLLEYRPFRFIRTHISAIAFGSGFILDTLTLKRIDLVYENIVFISYLLTAAFGIILLHAVETGRFAPAFLSKHRAWLPVIVQLPLGGLFSGFVIFYTKSASFVTSWPFLLLLVGLFIGNEFFRKRYSRLVFQMSVFYFVLLTYLTLLVPTVLGTIGTSTFVFAGLLSLLLIGLFIHLVMYLFPMLYVHSMVRVWVAVLGICAAFNALYFTNIIPPVPLALMDIGIYHSIVRTETGYRVMYEEHETYFPWRSTARTFHRGPGEAAYCFSSVFAPTRLRTSIYHVWERKVNDAWIRESRIPFRIQGGRDQGYRGYTLKANLTDGLWRCAVVTERGQVLGRERFVVVSVPLVPPLVEGVR